MRFPKLKFLCFILLTVASSHALVAAASMAVEEDETDLKMISQMHKDLIQVALYNGSNGRISQQVSDHFKLDYSSVEATNQKYKDVAAFHTYASHLGRIFLADTTFRMDEVNFIQYEGQRVLIHGEELDEFVFTQKFITALRLEAANEAWIRGVFQPKLDSEGWVEGMLNEMPSSSMVTGESEMALHQFKVSYLRKVQNIWLGVNEEMAVLMFCRKGVVNSNAAAAVEADITDMVESFNELSGKCTDQIKSASSQEIVAAVYASYEAQVTLFKLENSLQHNLK